MPPAPTSPDRGLRRLLRHARGFALSSSPVAKAGLSVLAVELLGLLLALATQALLARWLGVEAFGTFAYAQSWLASLLVLAKGGSELAALRFVPAYVESAAWGALASFLRRALLRVVAAASALAVAVALVAQLLPSLAPDLVQSFWVLAVALPADSLVEVVAAALKGLKRAPLAQGIASLGRRGLCGLAVLVALLGGATASAPRAMLLSLAASVVALVALGLSLARALPPQARAARGLGERSAKGEAIAALFAFGLLSAVLARLDTLLLGMLRTTTEAGIYSVASRLAGLALFGQMAVNSALAPEISRSQVSGSWKELERTTILCARIATAFALAVALGLTVAGRFLLAGFGSAFEAAWLPLLILLLGQLVSAASGSVGNLMNMTGHQGEALGWMVGLVLAELALLALLIPPLGALGAAIATAGSIATLNIGLAVRVRKVLGVRSTVFSRLPLEGSSKRAARAGS